MRIRNTRAPLYGPTAFRLILAILFVVGTLAGCGSSSEDSGNDDFSGPCLALTPSGVPGTGTVTLEEGSDSTCDDLEIDVMVTDVTDVFAVAFEFTYDSNFVTYQGYSTSGSFLGSGPTVPVLEEFLDANRIGIGMGRLSQTGVNATGTELLIHLHFKREQDSGTANVAFGAAAILGSETPPLPKAGIDWFGGLLGVIIL